VLTKNNLLHITLELKCFGKNHVIKKMRV